MSSYIHICNKIDFKVNNKYNKIVLNDMKTKVKTLSEMVSKEYDLTEDTFDLMCFGRILNPNKSLDSYEITNGTTVWVINKTNLLNPMEKKSKSDTESETSKAKINQSDIQHMVIALKTALMDASFRQVLDKLSDGESRDNLMAVTPGLREDPTVLAILQDPDLLSILSEPTNIYKVLERHPCLLEAATHLSAQFHEETIKKDSPSGSGLLSRSASNFSYSLDAMSDDEDMEESDPNSEANPTNNTLAQRIADVMVRAFQSNQNSGNASNSSNQSNSSQFVTPDMLRQALQQSTSFSQPSTSTPTPSVSSTSSSTGARIRGWATQLQQMRDLGITDEIVAIQALEATDGDVQSAINIIFSDNN